MFIIRSRDGVVQVGIDDETGKSPPRMGEIKRPPLRGGQGRTESSVPTKRLPIECCRGRRLCRPLWNWLAMTGRHRVKKKLPRWGSLYLVASAAEKAAQQLQQGSAVKVAEHFCDLLVLDLLLQEHRHYTVPCAVMQMQSLPVLEKHPPPGGRIKNLRSQDRRFFRFA